MNQELISLQQALSFSPNNWVLKSIYASKLIENNLFEEAETELKQIVENTSATVEVKLQLAKVFLQNKKKDAALMISEELMNEDEDNAEVLKFHAKIKFQFEQYEDAFEAYQKAVKLDENLVDETFASLLNDKVNAKVPQPALDADATHLIPNVILEKSSIQFGDVGGMSKVKEDISLKIIYPLKNQEIYKAYGKKIGGGILFYGPPGCGKTMLSRATAGEINLPFISMGLNDILDMWMGNSEKNLHEVFQTARRSAPCILFFDEIDAIGANRSDMRQSAGRTLINQFLDELDGVKYSNEGIMILGATNCPWYVDNAFKRPGRFDKVIFVSPPDAEARKAILKLKLKDKPVGTIDYDSLAKKTENYSGADLNAIVEQAIEFKISESMHSGVIKPLETADLAKAIASGRATTSEWFATAKNYALFSNESGLYDDILTYLKLK